MNTRYKLINYCPTDKMSDLISERYHMLLILNRFGIDLGFSDSTIEQVCTQHNIDLKTFLAIVNLIIFEDKQIQNYSEISLPTLIAYLRKSHEYFSEYKFKKIRKELKETLEKDNAVSKVVLNYYDEYVEEVEKHMVYEDAGIFSFVESLSKANPEQSCFNIDDFAEHHESVDDKLTELKNILIKYYPVKSTNELSGVLFDIFTCEQDLYTHTQIEDFILIPAIRARVEK